MAMSYIDAAREVLKEHPKGLKVSEIFRIAVERGYVKPSGKTPQSTMRGNIYQHVKYHPEDSDFVSVGDGKWALTRRKK